MMMKTYKLLLLGLGALWFTSCEKELDRDLTDVSVSVATNENVRYEGNILTVKRGTPIEFLLHGDPDYVSFFSGEIGHQYIYRDRKEINVDDIESCILKFSVWAQYGKGESGELNSCRDMFDVLYLAEKEDPANPGQTIVFPGLSKTNFEADSILVEKQTPWEVLIPRTELPQKPVSNATQATPCERSVKDYIGKKLTVAFVVNKDEKEAPFDPKGSAAYPDGSTIIQSTFHVQDMHVETKWKNGRVTKLYASSFGFTPLNMKNKTEFKDQNKDYMPADREYGSVTAGGVNGLWNLTGIASGGMVINGTSAGNPWKYSWLVSDYINLVECPEVDSSVKVKDVSLDVDTYSYTYDQVGTYTATFLMNNFSYAHEASKICELIINVTE